MEIILAPSRGNIWPAQVIYERNSAAIFGIAALQTRSFPHRSYCIFSQILYILANPIVGPQLFLLNADIGSLVWVYSQDISEIRSPLASVPWQCKMFPVVKICNMFGILGLEIQKYILESSCWQRNRAVFQRVLIIKMKRRHSQISRHPDYHKTFVLNSGIPINTRKLLYLIGIPIILKAAYEFIGIVAAQIHIYVMSAQILLSSSIGSTYPHEPALLMLLITSETGSPFVKVLSKQETIPQHAIWKSSELLFAHCLCIHVLAY